MLALSKLLQQQAEKRECVDMVDSLLQRVTESVLPDDRREALSQLRDLLSESGGARAAFGSVGLPLTCSLIRDFKDDTHQLQVALECLSLAVGQSGAEGQAAAVNAEQLLRSAECVPLLLSLLDDEPLGCTDFYVRFSTLDVLKGLLAANAQLLQEAVLAAPLGLSRLVGVLGERDALRNEGLLLLQHLVLGNAEVQKIMAFEGAFDRTLAILREEGLMDGGIVVQDCLQLLLNLLYGNTSNQLMFREMGFLAQFLALVATAAADAGSQGSGSQACHNLLAALQVLTTLVLPAPKAQGQGQATQRVHNREVLAQQRSQPILLAIAQGPPACPDAAVRAQALACLAGLLSGGPIHAQLSEPSISQLVWVALHVESEAEAAAADAALEALYVGNASAQGAAALGLLSKGQAELLRALASNDPQLCSRAASLVAHIVRGNAQAKQQLCQQLSQQLAHCTRQLAGLLLAAPAGGSRTAQQQQQQQCCSLRFLKLLLSWLPDCAPAVTTFLQAASAAPFLVGAVSGALVCDAAVRRLMAVLLGVCALAPLDTAPDSAVPSVPLPAMLMGVIVGQIGLEEFRGLLSTLGQYLAVAGPWAGAGMQPSYVPVGAAVTMPFYEYATGLAAHMSDGVASAGAGSRMPEPEAEQLHLAPAPTSGPRSLPGWAPHAQPSTAVHSSCQVAQPRSASNVSARLPDPMLAVAVQHAGLVGNALDPRLSGASQTPATPHAIDHAECKSQISQLKEQLKSALHESEASRADACKLRDAVLKLESELEGLSTAYAMLEAHSRELQLQLERERETHMAGFANGSNQDAPEDADGALDDLLVCLGREEAKVARLSAYLSKLNIDPLTLIGDLDQEEQA